jgi:hypothetical protein
MKPDKSECLKLAKEALSNVSDAGGTPLVNLFTGRELERLIHAAYELGRKDGATEARDDTLAQAIAATRNICLRKMPTPVVSEYDSAVYCTAESIMEKTIAALCALSSGAVPATAESAGPVAALPTNHEEACIYAGLHTQDSNLARCYLDLALRFAPSMLTDAARPSPAQPAESGEVEGLVGEGDFIKDAHPDWDHAHQRTWAQLQAAQRNKMIYRRLWLQCRPSAVKAGPDTKVADSYLNALLRYTGDFYASAIEHGMRAGPAADTVAHVERAARALHAMAISAPANTASLQGAQGKCVCGMRAEDKVCQSFTSGAFTNFCQTMVSETHACCHLEACHAPADSDETWACDYCERPVPEGNDEVWLGKNHCFCSVSCLEKYQSQFDASDGAPADNQAGANGQADAKEGE